jgi:8-oxo-dGTP pyrophosphatase MutT (NUDIX family)
MQQMYKVFIFDKLIILSNEQLLSAKYKTVRQIEAASKKTIKEAYSNFVNKPAEPTLVIYNNESVKRLLDDFISLFWYVEAAGGMVYNAKGERLFIYRFGKWDLPKGKIERNESHEQAAVREVQEETGLLEVKVVEELPSTFHIFDHKGKKVLKRTYWFKMIYTGKTDPKPQLEEEITEAIWVSKAEIDKVYSNTYLSLKPLIIDE